MWLSAERDGEGTAECDRRHLAALLRAARPRAPCVGGALPHPVAAGCAAAPLAAAAGGEGARGEVRVRVRQGQRRVCQGLLVKFSASRAPARALWAAAGHPVALFGQLCAFGILAHRAGHESRAGRPSSRKVALYAH